MARPNTAAVRLLAGEREPVLVATTANITLSGLQTIDGVTLTAGDRVLVKNQTDAKANGIYEASSGVWYRAGDARSSRTINKGVTVHVQSGSANGGKVYAQQTLNPDMGDDNIVWGFYISDDIVAGAQAEIETSAAAAIADVNDAIDAAQEAETALENATATANTTAADLITEIQNAGESILGSVAFPVFASKTAAEAYSPDFPAIYVLTMGYAAAGDGGYALWKHSNTEPSHPGKLQTADGEWFEYVGTSIDIRALGAKCDGAHPTEDTAAATKAKQMVEAGKLFEIRLPDNSTTLTNNSGAWAFAAGRVKITGSRTSVLKVANGANIVSALTAYGTCAGMELEGFTVDGNRANGGLANDSTAIASNVNNIAIRDVEIANCPRYGVQFLEPTPGTPVRFVTITRSHIYAVGSVNSTSNNGGSGVYGHVENCDISHCRFDNIYPLVAPLGDCAAVNIYGRVLSVTDSTFKDVLNFAGGVIVVGDGGDGSGACYAFVGRNSIENTVRFSAIVPLATDDQTGGVELAGSFAVASDNLVQSLPAVGIGTGVVHDVDIHDNIIDASATGVNVPGASARCNVRGNTIKNATWGLGVGGGQGIVFANNILSNVTQTVAGSNAIRYGNVGGDNYMQVSELPSAASNPGLRLQVADANETAFNAGPVTGGSSNARGVISDGTIWRIG